MSKDTSWDRFNALKLVKGCAVTAMFRNAPGVKHGPYVYAILLEFKGKDQAIVRVTKSSFKDCQVGSTLRLRIEHLTVAIKQGTFPGAITNEQYLHHEGLMQFDLQLQLF